MMVSAAFATNRIAGICQINNWYPDIYSSFFCGPFTGKEYLTPDKKIINYSGSLEKGIDAQKDIEYVVKNKDTICFVHHWYKLFLQEQENVKFIKHEFPTVALLHRNPNQFCNDSLTFADLVFGRRRASVSRVPRVGPPRHAPPSVPRAPAPAHRVRHIAARVHGIRVSPARSLLGPRR